MGRGGEWEYEGMGEWEEAGKSPSTKKLGKEGPFLKK
jgi:hypothetical protein